jgi:hypothetical protein
LKKMFLSKIYNFFLKLTVAAICKQKFHELNN